MSSAVAQMAPYAGIRTRVDGATLKVSILKAMYGTRFSTIMANLHCAMYWRYAADTRE